MPNCEWWVGTQSLHLPLRGEAGIRKQGGRIPGRWLNKSPDPAHFFAAVTNSFPADSDRSNVSLESWVRPAVPMKRSAMAFARGARIGVRMMRILAPVKTASNAAVNLLSRSRIKNRNRLAWSPSSMSRLRACCSIQPVSGLLVIAKYSTRRLPIEMKAST